MSELECKCREINELRPDIERLSNAYNEMVSINNRSMEIENYFSRLKENQDRAYETDNKCDVLIAIQKLYEEYRPAYQAAMNEIQARKSAIEEYKSRLSKIDSDYHEAERRSREKAAEEARHRANAARQGK